MLGTAEIEKLDRQMRSGVATDVRAKLSETQPSKVPRKWLAPLSQLAWRAGLAEWGLKALRPAVRVVKDATDAERLEYGACLLRSGLLGEGLEVLNTVSLSRHPKALLYRGFAWMARWEYRQAQLFLKAFLKEIPARSYDALTARVNLAACLVFLREDTAAEALLSALLHDASVRGHRLLHGNVLHLGAACFVQTGKLKKAHALLDSAAELLGKTTALDNLFLDKWRALAGLAESGPKSSVRESLDGVRKKASEVGHWETHRDLDRHWCLASHDEKLFRKVYFGTPYVLYRDNLVSEWGAVPEADTYVWSSGSGAAKTLDWLSGGGPLKRGQLLYRVLRELTRDFYRPAQPGELFARLFPGEYFDPEVSGHRVHEGVRRLRETFEQSGVPVELPFEGGAYRLVASAKLGVTVPAPGSEGGEGPALEKLRAAFSRKDFSVSRAASEMDLPLRSAQRLLKSLTETGGLARTGKGKGTRYRLAKP